MTTPARGAPEQVRSALRSALAAAGLQRADQDARLIRHGSNAVFAVGPVVARVAPDTPQARAAACRALDVARWLQDQGFPAVRAVADPEQAGMQPVIAQGQLVTFWHSLGDDPPHGSTRDLGQLLRHFHALDLPPGLRPEPMDPVGRILRQLADADHLDPDDRAFLSDRLDGVRAGYDDVDLALPPGHLHGDATVANVVLDRAGRPTLIDLDLLRTGPREWDLLRTAVYARRLGWHTIAEYQDFTDAYGVDVTAHPAFEVLADLCELLQIAWLAQAAGGRPQLRDELGVRIASLRTAGSRRTWRVV